jgi:hypothetical protein
VPETVVLAWDYAGFGKLTPDELGGAVGRLVVGDHNIGPNVAEVSEQGR